MKKTVRLGLSVVFAMMLGLLIYPVSATAAETPMKLSKVQGTVAILDGNNRALKAVDNMEVLSGYNVVTNQASYAWISLGDNNLIKMDALSKTMVSKSGNNVMVELVSGKVLFDVSSPLANGESLIIRSGNVLTSVGNASGEIKVVNGNTVIVGFEGQISSSVVDARTGQLRAIPISAGRLVEIDNSANGIKVESRAATNSDISGFSKLQILQNPVLNQRIVNGSGSKLGNISIEETVASINEDTIRQAVEVEVMAASMGVDSQTLINNMMGADISPKVLTDAVHSDSSTATENTVSSQTVTSTADQESDDSSSVSNTPGHEHSYRLVSTEAATCTTEGSEVYECSGCSHRKTEIIPSTHDLPSGAGVIRVVEGAYADNCSDIEIGEYKRCIVCDNEIEVSRRNKYPSHNLERYDEWKQPTCSEEGKETYHCTNRLANDNMQCTYEEKRLLSKLPHSYDENGVCTECNPHE